MTDDIDRDDWGTPPWLIELAREVLGSIDLDPFSSLWHNERVRAATYFGHDRGGGLALSWELPVASSAVLRCSPSRVWCNPPYSRGLISACVKRWLEAADEGEMLAGLILTNVDTSTTWCQSLMEHPHCFLCKRIAFIHPTTVEEIRGNRNASMVTYAGPRYPAFRRVFGEHGVIR